ncbi:MAG: hypothetical protein ABI947_18185 [Chloroflexota bacterium]
MIDAKNTMLILLLGVTVWSVSLAFKLPSHASTLAASAQQATAVPMLHSILGIAPVPALDPMPTGDDLGKAYVTGVDMAYNAGARGVELDKTWKDLEPSQGHFNLDDLESATSYMIGIRGFEVLLNIQIINTVSREMPTDLNGQPFDSPAVRGRFHTLIDAIAPHLNPHYRYVAIGNEVDVYLATSGEWKAYQAFYEDSIAYIHKVLPWIKVGVTCTFDGATLKSPKEVAALNTTSDIYIVSYYPLKGNFVVRSPDAPLTDFPKLAAMAGTRPLVLQEVGYPTSELLSSSEQQQAAFVTNVFKAWAALGDKISWLDFYMLHDMPESLCNDLSQYYRLPDSANFKAYLCSLGLHKANGTPKLGWQAFMDSVSGIQS